MDTNLIIGIVAAVVIVVLLIVWGVVRGRSRKNEVVGRPAETATSPRQAGRAGEEPETVAATVDRQLSAPETEGEAASPRSEEERKPVEPTQAAPARPAAPAYDVPEKSGSRIQRLKAKLSKSSNPFGKALFNILTKDNLSESDWEDVEDTLLLADVGAEASDQLVGELRRDARITGKTSPDEVRATLRDNLLDLVGRDTDRRLNVDKPDAHKPGVIIMVGVNGTGKTTTAGKLARLFVSEDKKVVMGAADTFRAAAADQLETWGARVNVPVVRSDKDGADPASVAFEAAARAKEDDADVLIIDTAGRLQNKSNLMDELGYDDSLDVVGVHGVGGLTGTVLIGFFGEDAGLLAGGDWRQLAVQVIIALCAMLYSGVVTAIIAFALEKTIGWRVTEAQEVGGIDLADQGERAYDFAGTASSVLKEVR